VLASQKIAIRPAAKRMEKMPAEPEHRARLVELAVAVGGPVGPLFPRLRPGVVVVHEQKLRPETRNGALVGRRFS
jgi:hypothetical protein